MQRGLIRGTATAVVAAVALAFAGQALAGSAPDPRPGDKVLGTKGGITYVSDTEHVTNPAFADALAACPNAGGRSRILGGGIRIAGLSPDVTIKASRPLDLADFFGDPDTVNDDYWETSAAAPVGTPLTSYAICAKFKGLKYKTIAFPDQPTGVRLSTGSCSAGRKVTGGGGFIATTGSRITSMYPSAADKWSVGAFDAIGGLGGTTLDFVCMKSRHLKTVTAKRTLPAGGASFKSAVCPAKSHVVGGGALLDGGPLTSALNSSYPADTDDRGKTPDDGWTAIGFNDGAAPEKLKVFAICLS